MEGGGFRVHFDSEYQGGTMRSGTTKVGMLVALLLFTSTAFGGVEIEPNPLELILNPGDTETVTCSVTIPCDTAPPKADIYLLADTTGSMGAILQAVQDAADELVDTILGTPNVDTRIGVGNYKDFNNSDPYGFQHQLSPSDVAQDIKDALNTWSAAGGSDPPEAQLYALTKIATDPAIGFRAGTDVKRIVVWFGDRPGHDPICENIHLDGDVPYDVTLGTTIADLLASGETGTTVVAISTRIGKPGALDEDPDPFNLDYENCEPNGGPNQADDITAATGGDHIDVLQDPSEIVEAILSAIEAIFERVDVELEAVGDIVPFITDIDPLIYEDVEIPLCEVSPELIVDFDVTFEGQDCIENQSHYFGGLRTLIDGQIQAVKEVLILQPECVDVVCNLIVGAKRTEQQVGPDPRDILLLKPKRPKRDYMFPVTMDIIPEILVPNDPKLNGKKIYMQVYMINESQFPNDPLQLSNGLEWEIGSGQLPTVYGPNTTIDLVGQAPLPIGGAVDIAFSIEGM